MEKGGQTGPFLFILIRSFSMRTRFILILSILLAGILSCKKDTSGKTTGIIQLSFAKIGALSLSSGSKTVNVPADQPVQLLFSSPVDTTTVRKGITITKSGGATVAYSYTPGDNLTSLILTPASTLQYSTDYTLALSGSLRGLNGETFPGVQFQFTTIGGSLAIDSIKLNGTALTTSLQQNINPKKIVIEITFSQPLDPNNYQSGFSFNGPSLSFVLSNSNKTLLLTSTAKAHGLTKYLFSISSSLVSAQGYTFPGFSSGFYTGVDSTYQFPQVSDDDLLTLVQQQTFKYFWDFGHPSCGMARERNTSGDIVTTGGSGFGIMAMIVAMQRGFISRSDGLARLDKILGFLETCDRFHGVWPHWLNGVTGKTQPFSPTDNGGDLVETSYMIEGLLAMRQYLDSTNVTEATEIHRITSLFNAVEFDWFTNGQKVLYWTWSPNYGFNLKIQGYNETLITYILAASSPTHSITADTYTNGYANNGGIKNGKTYFNYLLPLGGDFGGPLFFTHYSFLGLDPRHLKDQFADYWLQNVNQSLINYTWCVTNPRKYPGYGPGIWGLTASDNPWGYNAQSPTNDLGVITPTAALSSVAYTPVQSLNALRTFYYFLGDRLWGSYGFYDAFDVTESWWATSTLAIDQGPIICMIENYRTALLWNLFMTAPEVRNGLTKLGFTY
jgi:hypothetical protein